MRRFFSILCTVPFMVGCSRGPVGSIDLPASQSAAIRDSVTTFIADWREAVMSLDTLRATAFYAPDTSFRWIEDGRVRYTSARELLAAWGGTVPGLKAMELILDQTEVRPLAPGIASVTTSFTQRVTDSAGRQGGFAGATSLIVVHTKDGWRFLTGHTSAAGGPPVQPPRGEGG